MMVKVLGWCFSLGVWRQGHGRDAATANDTGDIRMRRLKLLCRKELAVSDD